MAQQTAVEWFYRELKGLHDACYDTNEAIDILYEKARQMEREQIIEAAKINLWCAIGDGSDQAEQYYNETYGKE